MTRIEFLIVICIALIGIYLVVRYQRMGEVFQITWRKDTFKETEIKTVSSVEVSLPIASRPTRTNSGNAPPVLLVTNLLLTHFARQEANRGVSPVNVNIRLANRRKHKVLLPTNAVWFPIAARKGPGVRICFP